MSEMTQDKNELMRRWMKIYLNLRILRSRDTHEQTILDEMKGKLDQTNGWMMTFFDSIGADPAAGAELRRA